MNNLYMIFHYENDNISAFSTVITQKAFDTFIGSNQPREARFVEEEIPMPEQFLGGATRPGLVHYLGDRKFRAYVPVFATEAEAKEYDSQFRR